MLVTSKAQAFEFIDALDYSKPLELVAKSANKISRKMQATWWMWMEETAEHMRGVGVTMPLCVRWSEEQQCNVPWGTRAFTDKDAHELYVKYWLGTGDTNERFSTATGDKGAMVWMMDRHISFCLEKGWELTIPEDGEYMRCRAAQEG